MRTINPYALVLSGHYDRDPGLDRYLMILIHARDGQLNQWTCTSSHTKGQQRGKQHEWGGLIPSTHHCRNLKMWEVNLTPIYMPERKGIRGNFYQILPYKVVTNTGAVRGDFGIHFDANVPGSLGCPVMDKFNFEDWENSIREIKKEGLLTVPLYPVYS